VSASPSSILQEGVDSRIFPSAQAAVVHQGRLVLRLAVGAAPQDADYDLASLTKPLSTTAIFLRLWSQGAVEPSAPIGRYFPRTPAAEAGVTLADLLYHRAGLPPVPLAVQRAFLDHPELAEQRCPPSVRLAVREQTVALTSTCELEQPVGAAAVYSDTGFILLAEALSRAASQPLDRLFDQLIARPLGLSLCFHRLSSGGAWPHSPPTGQVRPRPPPPEPDPSLPPIPPAPTRPGEVDDDRAFLLDGVAGHAGLFGTAPAVARFGALILEEFHGANRLAPGALWQHAAQVDPRTPGSTRALGFDTPTPLATGEPSSAGAYLGAKLPGALGHLGFTGTSLWLDRARELSVALLSNRTFNDRIDPRIRQLRPRFHDAVIHALGLES
jgi:serine-type D-Ala-D-Ala carboxypeptidase